MSSFGWSLTTSSLGRTLAPEVVLPSNSGKLSANRLVEGLRDDRRARGTVSSPATVSVAGDPIVGSTVGVVLGNVSASEEASLGTSWSGEDDTARLAVAGGAGGGAGGSGEGRAGDVDID